MCLAVPMKVISCKDRMGIAEMAGVKKGIKRARGILESGKAYEKMKEIIKAQQGNPHIKIKDIKLGNYKFNVLAKKGGKVKRMDNELIAKIARVAGAPQDKSAGLYLKVRLGDRVKKGDLLWLLIIRRKVGLPSLPLIVLMQ